MTGRRTASHLQRLQRRPRYSGAGPEQAGINPETVDYVEVHGTSSLLGDEIELFALKESFGSFTKRKGFCAIGSLKPNIGHPIAAAGMACLLKVLLTLRYQQLPPLAGLEKVNEALGLEASPFYLSTGSVAWKRRGGRPRRAAINGLSASGTNCHLIIDEYIPESEQIKEGPLGPSYRPLVNSTLVPGRCAPARVGVEPAQVSRTDSGSPSD